jgi:mannan endo-1,6-alpha-mannosidase
MKDICEQNNACDVDQHSFKAYLSRWMTAATQMAPFTAPIINPLLLSSAQAATAQCVGAPTGNVCGLKWYNNGTWDGTAGVGQQMAALEVVLGTLVGMTTGAVTNSTGGTSPSNPSAGYNASSIPPGQTITPPTKADKVGAWFLTALWIVMTLWVWWFMNSRGWERRGERPTVGGKAGRRGRTVSTFEMGATNGVSLASAATRLSYVNGVSTTLVHEVSPSDEASKTDGAERDENEKSSPLPLHTERPLSSRNTLTKAPDRSSTFSSTGVFPSDRNAKTKSQLHVRAQSYFGVGERRGSRALPPIHERERGERRRRRSEGGLFEGGGGGGGKEEGKEKEGRGSRFKEEISGESESRLD